MALSTKRLEDCNLEVEHLVADNWAVIFFDDNGYKWTTEVMIQNGTHLRFNLSLEQMRLQGEKLVPFSYIEEQEQVQRVLDAINQARECLGMLNQS
jgi:hypothetical protein